jgi:hypothetical protein
MGKIEAIGIKTTHFGSLLKNGDWLRPHPEKP